MHLVLAYTPEKLRWECGTALTWQHSYYGRNSSIYIKPAARSTCDDYTCVVQKWSPMHVTSKWGDCFWRKDDVTEEVVTDITDVAASTLQDKMDNDDLTCDTEETVYDWRPWRRTGERQRNVLDKKTMNFCTITIFCAQYCRSDTYCYE